jgi:hypothetical protein
LLDSPGFPRVLGGTTGREKLGTTGRENRERKGDKLGMTVDTSATCYYEMLVDSGLIGKIDSYLSFLRRQESSQEKIIDKGIERFI